MDAINLTGRLNLTVNTAKVEAQLAALGKQAPIKITATLPTSQLRAYREELTRVRKASKEVEDGFSDFAEKAALAGKRFAAFTVATTGFFALASAIKSGISTASDFEVELLRVQQVTRESARNISGLKESIFGVAKGLGVSSKELLSVGLTLGQAGRSIQEIKDSLAPLAKTRLAATFGDITDTVNALIAAQEQFKVTSKDTEQVLGSINVLSAKYAVEAQDLTTAIQKAGGAFSSFANSAAEPKKNLNELLALFTAVRSTTRESADTIATGFRTIFARLRNPKNISALEAFGINLKDDKGLLLKPLEQIRAISRAVKDLDKRDIRFSQIIEEVGGIRQQSKVIPLLEQMEKAEQALVTATQGANSLTRDAQIAQESLANQLAKTREEFLKLINDGFSSEEFKTFAKTALGIASALIKVGEAIGPLLPAFATLAATKFILPDAAGQLSGYQKVTKAVHAQFGPHKKFASGGPVGGSGSGDKVPAMLEPGEFVIPKSATRKLGHGFLESLRRGDKPRGYSTGGSILNEARKGRIRFEPNYDGFGQGYVTSEASRIYKRATRLYELEQKIAEQEFTAKNKAYDDEMSAGGTHENASEKYKHAGAQYKLIRERIKARHGALNSINRGDWSDGGVDIAENRKRVKSADSDVIKSVTSSNPGYYPEKPTNIKPEISTQTAAGVPVATIKKPQLGFNYEPNKVIKNLDEANKLLGQFFKGIGIPLEQVIKNVRRFSKQEEFDKPGRLGTSSGIKDTRQSTISIRPGKATQEVLFHEVGHALSKYLQGEEAKTFRSSSIQKDPVTKGKESNLLKTEALRVERENLRERKASGEKLTAVEKKRLSYLEHSNEQVARGFSTNPLAIAQKAIKSGIGVSQYSGQAGPTALGNIPYTGVPPVLPNNIGNGLSSQLGLPNGGSTGFPYKPGNFSKLSNSLLGDSGTNPNSVVAGLSRFETPPTKTKLGFGTIDSLSESVQKDPMKASLISFTLLGLSEKFAQADDATARFAKAITTGASQFILLNTVLSTFGRTAKQKALLEQESEQHLGQQSIIDQQKGAKVKRSGLLTNIKDLDKSKFNDESRIKATQGILEDLSNQHGNLKLSSSQREDLTTVRQLSKLNEALLNPDTKHKQSLISKIAQTNIAQVSYQKQIDAVPKFTRVDKKAQAGGAKVSKEQRLYDDLLKKKDAADRAHRNYEVQYETLLKGQATPAIVTDLVKENKDKISGILSKPENTSVGGTGAGLLNVSDRITQIQQKKRAAHQALKKLKKSHTTNSQALNVVIKEIQELDKLSEELSKGLDTPENRQRFSDSYKLNNNIQVPPRPPKGFLERIIGTKRATKEDLEKRSKFEGRLAFGSAVASGAGGLVTSFGQDTLKNTPDSGVGRGLAAAGSAATLGAEFAAIGTTIHPVVGILGGLGGALYGFKKSLDETGNAIQDIAIDKNLTEFAKLVELVNDKEKRGGIGTNIKNASNLVTDTQNRVLSTGTKESRDKAENLAANAQNLLRGFAQTIGENNGTLKKFNEEGKTLIEFVSRFSNTSLKELDSQFKKIIEDTSKLSKANKQQIAISEREQTRGILSTGILGAFEDVSASLNEFDAILNGGISDLSSVFKRIGQISDSQLLERANKQAGSVLGRVEGGADFLKENQLINEIGRELPTLLVEAFRNTKNPLEGQGPVETLSAALSERFKLPEQSSIKDSIVGQLIEATKNKSSSEIADLIQSNLKSGLVDPILSNLVKIGDVSTQAVQLRNQELKFLEGIYSRIGELNTNIRESQLGVVDLEEKRQTGLSPSNDIGLQRKLGFESQRLSIISGRSDNSVGSLAGVLGRARGRLKSIDEEKQLAGDTSLNDLAKRRSVELETISRVTKALDYLGKSATKLSSIEESISKEKSLRETKVGILKQYAFGSPDQKRESAQNLQIAQKLLETQDIRSVPGNLLQGGVGILEQFKDASYGGQKIDDIITKLAMQGGGLSGDLASQLGITKGKSEKDLEKERDNAIIVAQEALVASQNDLKSQTENLTSAINTQFPSFIENLTKLLLGNRETDLSIKFAQTKGKLDDVSAKREKMLALSSSLKGTGLNNLGSTDIGVLNSVVPELINKNKAKLGNDKLKNFGGIQGLNNLSGKGVIRKLESSRKELEDVYGNKITNDIISEIESGIGSVDIFEGKQGFANKVFGKYKNQAISQNNKTIKESDSNIGRQLDSNQQDSLEKNFHGEWGIRKLFEELDGLRGGNLQDITKQFNELTSSLEGIRVPLSNITSSLGINSNIAQQVSKLNLTGGLGFATGGGVPGLGNFDSVPAMLTPGEFVIRKSAAEALGPEVLNQLNGYNKGGRVKFDGGGPVQLQDTLKRRQESENERRERELANKANKEAAILSRRFGNDKEYNSLWDRADSEKEKHNTEVERRLHDFSPKFEPVKPHGLKIRSEATPQIPLNKGSTSWSPTKEEVESLADAKNRADKNKSRPGGYGQNLSERAKQAQASVQARNAAKASGTPYVEKRSLSDRSTDSKNMRDAYYEPNPYKRRESKRTAYRQAQENTVNSSYDNRPNQRNSYEQFKGKQTDLSLGIPGQKGVNRPDFNKTTKSPDFRTSSMKLVDAERRSLLKNKSYSHKPYEFPNTPIRRAAGVGTGPSTVSGASRGITCELNTESLEKFNKAISEFSKPADKLAIALEKFPTEFTMQGEHNVHVMVTGADALASLEDTFGKLVEAKIKKAINDTTDRIFGGNVPRMV